MKSGTILPKLFISLAYSVAFLDCKRLVVGRLGTWLMMFAGVLIGAGAVSYGLPVQSNASSQDCSIKGNINPTTGARIYHLPGQQFYSATTIDPRFGERLFCSEEEARTAGWRKARR